MTQHRLIFLCRDNTCRSVLAEAAMRQVIAQEDRLDDFLLTSRAVQGDAGARASRIALGAAARKGIDLSGFRSRHIAEADFRNHHLLLAMDRQSCDRLKAMAPLGCENRIHGLMDFAPWTGALEVPDPAQQGDRAADDVFELLQIVARSLICVIDQSAAELMTPVRGPMPLSRNVSSVR
jgi:protein-tyrosine phosphatase